MPFSHGAENVVDWHGHVVQHEHRRGRSVEAELLLVRTALHAHAAFDEEGGELLAVDLGEHREQVGKAAVGDPRFLSVQEVMPAVRRQPRGGLCRQRVRAGVRLGERVGADQVGAGQPGQILRLLLRRAEIDDRQSSDRGVRPQRPGKRGIDRDVFADIRGADLVEAESAIGGGNLEAKQVEIRGLLQQLARLDPVVCVEARLVGQHLVPHELGGGLAEQALFVGQVFAREQVIRVQ